jgi:class 3 adenylate cyclase
MVSLPSGTVTFLLTDIEASTALWERQPEAMRAAVARHEAVLTAGVERHGGVVIRSRGEGDSIFAVFARAGDGVAAACASQQALLSESWPSAMPLRVRMALHAGEAELRDGNYYGEAVNRCARLRAAGHGGQILLSEATTVLVRDALPAEAALWALGEHRLRHLTRPERIFQLLAPGLPSEFPHLNTIDAVPGSFRPGGDYRELTVLFSDVRGFTALAQALNPDQVFVTLNEYLTAMSDVIYDFQGTLDKFMGDGILAFWGAPVRQEDHAGLACRAALRMVEELGRLNQEWARAGRPPLAISVGINTGEMLVGNVGSVSRFDYTVMGDAVNIGSRLEQLNRTYGTSVIVSAATVRRAGGLRSRFLDAVPLGAAREPVEIFELLEDAAPREEIDAALRAYDAGIPTTTC